MLKLSFVLLWCVVAIKAQYNSYLPPTAGGYSAQGRGRPSGSYGQARSLSSLYRPAPSQVATTSYQSGGGGGSYNGGGRDTAGGASSQYGAPGGYNAGYGRYASTEDPLAEPANYEFSYEVVAPEYGVQFGHQESRRDEQTVGTYNVLLPDGRTQIVQYEADQGGYRPTITYQEPAGGYGGGAGGYGGGAGGYGNGAGGYGGGAGGYGNRGGGYGNGGNGAGGSRYAGGNGGSGSGGYAAGGGGYARPAGAGSGGAYAGRGAAVNYGGAAGRNAY